MSQFLRVFLPILGKYYTFIRSNMMTKRPKKKKKPPKLVGCFGFNGSLR